jgi:hypothetical protein
MGLAAIGSLQAGAAANQAARYNAELARMQGRANRDLAYRQAIEMERGADEVERVGAFNLARRREADRLAIGQDRATLAGRGVTLEGSPLEVLAYQVGQAEIEAETIRMGALADAARLREEARLERWRGDAGLAASSNAATAQEFAGRQARTASYFQAGSQLLGGAGRAGMFG